MCLAPLTSRKGWSSFGRGRLVSSSQIELPIHIVQLKLALESREATFWTRLDTLARVERMVGMAEGFVTDSARKVADRVRGAIATWVLAVVKLPITPLDDLMGAASWADFVEKGLILLCPWIWRSRSCCI